MSSSSRRRFIRVVTAGGAVSLAGCDAFLAKESEKLSLSEVLRVTTETVPSSEGPNGKAGVRVTMTNMHDNVTVTDASVQIFDGPEDDGTVLKSTIRLDKALGPGEYRTWFIPLEERYHEQMGPIGWSPQSWQLSRPTPR